MLSKLSVTMIALLGIWLHFPCTRANAQAVKAINADKLATLHAFMEKAALLNTKVIEHESIRVDAARKLVIKEQLAIDVSGQGYDYKRYEKPAAGMEYLQGDVQFTLEDFVISTRIENLEKQVFLKKQEKVVHLGKVSKPQCARGLSHIIKAGTLSPILEDVPGERMTYLRDRSAKLLASGLSGRNDEFHLHQITKELEALGDRPPVMINFSMFPHTNTTPGRNTKFSPSKDGLLWAHVETYDPQSNRIVGRSSTRTSNALPPALKHPETWKTVKSITAPMVEKTVKPPQDVPVVFGITIEKLTDGDLGVISIKPGSIAEKAGVNAGDRIVEIDGVPAKDISLEMCSKLLWYNKRIKITLANGKSIELAKD